MCAVHKCTHVTLPICACDVSPVWCATTHHHHVTCGVSLCTCCSASTNSMHVCSLPNAQCTNQQHKTTLHVATDPRRIRTDLCAMIEPRYLQCWCFKDGLHKHSYTRGNKYTSTSHVARKLQRSCTNKCHRNHLPNTRTRETNIQAHMKSMQL